MPAAAAAFGPGTEHRRHEPLPRVAVDLPPSIGGRVRPNRGAAAQAVVTIRVDAVDPDATAQPHAVRHFPVRVDVAAKLGAQVVPRPVAPLVEVDVALTIQLRRLVPLVLHPGELPLVA